MNNIDDILSDTESVCGHFLFLLKFNVTVYLFFQIILMVIIVSSATPVHLAMQPLPRGANHVSVMVMAIQTRMCVKWPQECASVQILPWGITVLHACQVLKAILSM